MAAATSWDERTADVLRRLARPAFWVSLAAKLAIGGLGIAVLVTPGERAELALLVGWCALGTLYIVGVAVGLVLASRFAVSDRPPMLSEIGVVPRVASILLALIGVGVGLLAAIEHTLIDKTSLEGWSANLVGIWAMILAWLLLHWGFAQVYLQEYYRFSPRSLTFPHDGAPGVVEFAYFAYGIAVSLAVSDVVVRATRSRMLVLAHSVVSFFFNGLIIVTALAALAELAGLR